MSHSNTEELKIKAKLLVKQKKEAGEEFSLGQALDVMAVKRGHASWRDYKQTLSNDLYNPPFASARLNAWFSTYEEAKTYLAAHLEDYLLPYRKQYFVCVPDYVEALGVETGGTDLVLVGHDWVNPADSPALERIREKIKANWKKNNW